MLVEGRLGVAVFDIGGREVLFEGVLSAVPLSPKFECLRSLRVKNLEISSFRVAGLTPFAAET